MAIRPVRPLIIGLPLLLAGCGAPPAFLIASLAIDTVSFAATGKTPGEHAISAAVRQDCAVRRLIAEGELCTPVPDMAGDVAAGRQEAHGNPLSIDLSTDG